MDAQDEARVAYFKAQLSRPEDVVQWIQQRKANYPTRQNIARKQEQLASVSANGECTALPDCLPDPTATAAPRSHHRNHSVKRHRPNPGNDNPLATLCDYASSDSDMDPIHDAQSTKATNAVKALAGPQPPSQPQPRRRPHQLGSGKNRPQPPPARPRDAVCSRRPGLFQALVAPDIKRDHRIALQCLQYICDHRFFDVPVATKKPLVEELDGRGR
ncbi:hypothetical protein H4R35_000226 [Dimargaris xerosporica]|nr:hypothetical protein H4R35_000226 [Dimargaris xerosporica]